MAEAVLNENASMFKGETARMSAFVGAYAVADLVKSTLGPKGMDKILTPASGEGKLTITNDGATILRSIDIDNAAARVLINISKTQDEEVGDGTTSVVVLAGELLREAEQLLKRKVHPMTVIEGFRLAAVTARAALEASAVDNSKDEAKFRSDLMDIASTTLSSKLVTDSKNHFANLAVDAVLRLKGSRNLEHIQLLKKSGGTMADSYLAEGFILEKTIGVGQPLRVENARILLANTSMDTDKIKIYGSRVRVSELDQVAEIEAVEKEKMKAKVDKIVAHKCNVFINRQLIYNYPEQLFADAGIMSIEHVDFDGIERLAAVTGGEIASTFDRPDLVTLGECALIEETMIGEDKVIKFSGVKSGAACTIVLRGASSHILEEADRSLHDALCVLTATVKNPHTTLGGGCAETLMANAIDEAVPGVGGKKSLAMEAFARALRQMPYIIAENAGLDGAELVTKLRHEHHVKNNTAGIDILTGTVGDMAALGIREPLKLKLHVLLSASEAAEMILRVDDIIKCAPRQRQQGMDGMH
jgi:T-complex protein 1 subunit beta